MVSRTGGIATAALGLPAYLMQGRVLDSDVLSAVGSEPARTLSRELGIPVSVDNDMYFKALGFSQSSEGRGGTVTLFNAPRGVMPGSATVCEGVVYRGASGFACVLDMLPFGLDTQSVVEMLGGPVTAQPYLAFVMRSLIASMNPGRFIITGSLVDAEAVGSLEASVAKTVPTWAMPEFVYRPSFERWYLDGLVSWLQQGAGAGA